ncbi:MAG: RNA polymerase factor sigma-54 [Rikenellaceae bacterium]
MALTQTLSQSQLQKLSPQQIQGIKLLELPTLLLEQRIAREIEDNIVLEEEEKRAEENSESQSSNVDSLEEYIKAEQGNSSYRLRSNNYSVDDESRPKQISEGKSLSDFLLEQLFFENLTSRQRSIATFVVGSIDDDGYLHRSSEAISDDIAFKLALDTTTEEVEEVIAMVQQLEPVGIGARSLAECLLIQLSALKDNRTETALASKILSSYFTEFSKRHYQQILLKTGASEEELKEAIEIIVSLNPKPANGYSDESSSISSPVIIPDFKLDYDEETDNFSLEAGGRGLPELRINRDYLKMAEKALSVTKRTEKDKEAIEFVRGKVESAKWFISAIKQRQQTLLTTMRAILDFQREFFKSGEEAMLRPMILRDIALSTGFDISTISRVVNSKYIETHFGTYLLKFFFSEGLSTEDGGEVSTREIKRIITQSIEAESGKDPLTDEALMEMLHSKGYKIARRTVAKYREMMQIPVARLRKRL